MTTRDGSLHWGERIQNWCGQGKAGKRSVKRSGYIVRSAVRVEHEGAGHKAVEERLQKGKTTRMKICFIAQRRPTGGSGSTQ